MTIRFVLLVNKQGQTRLAQYYEYLTLEERRALEGEIVRKCLARPDNQVSVLLLLFLRCLGFLIWLTYLIVALCSCDVTGKYSVEAKVTLVFCVYFC